MGDKIITTKEFEKLFCENYSRLYYFAYDFVEDIEISKDIVSDVFASIWSDKKRMEKDKVIGYLYVSVRNQCFNHLKKQKNKEKLFDSAESLNGEDDEEWSAMEERIDKMTEIMDKMPPRTRYVLEECYYHNKKYREVAEILGITTDGVKKHIVKAFALLRQHFDIKK